LDDASYEVRNLDEQATVTWKGGLSSARRMGPGVRHDLGTTWPVM
jgi:hypothetical protein